MLARTAQFRSPWKLDIIQSKGKRIFYRAFEYHFRCTDGTIESVHTQRLRVHLNLLYIHNNLRVYVYHTAQPRKSTQDDVR